MSPKYQIAGWVSHPGPNAHVEVKRDVAIPEPGAGEVLLKLEYTGVCQSDVHGIYGVTPMTTTIPGHEGVGRVLRVGPGVSQDYVDKRLGLKWLYSSCDECEICAVNNTACPKQQNTGRNVPGTFQQYAIAAVRHLTEIRPQLSPSEVTPLLCAGLTAYSAILKTKLAPNDWLVIPGAGGGLGHIGVQIGRAMGYRVIAIDTGVEKRALCLQLGAAAFLDYEQDDVESAVKSLTDGYGAHGVVCTASSTGAYQQSLKVVRNLGTLVCIGLNGNNLPISPLDIVIRGLHIVGSSVGTADEMEQLLDMAVAGQVKASTEVFDFEKVDEVVQRLARMEVGGRVVLRLPP